MKEVKSPKKPLLYYYGIVLLIIALFNLLVTPLLNRRSIEEVDYGTFMSKIEAQQIEKVEIDDDEIYYTEKGGKTGLLHGHHGRSGPDGAAVCPPARRSAAMCRRSDVCRC